MKRIKFLFSIIMIAILLVGCKNQTNKVEDQRKEVSEDSREVINVPYVESGLGEDVKSNEVEDIIKSNKGKFVRWTANVREIKKKEIVIQLEGLTRVEAMFNYNVNEDKQIKEGDIITISGNLKKYYPAVFIIPPIWVLENCRIEESTEDEKKIVADYNKKMEEDNKKVEEEANKIISNDYKSFYETYISMTEVQQNDYFNSVYGKCVQWTGFVGEVTRDYICVKCLDYTFGFDYIAYFTPEDIETLKTINKGDEITIKGKIYTVMNKKQWQINNCTIIQ